MFDRMHFVGNGPAGMEPVLQQWKDSKQSLTVLVLLPEAQKDQVPAIQALFRQLDVPLLGAIFPALICGDTFVQQGAWLLGFRQAPPHFLVGELSDHGRSRLTEAVHGALDALEDDGEQPTLFLVFDSMVPDISSLLDDVHRHLTIQPLYSGVNAGSETFQPMPCLFDAHQLVSNGVLGWASPAGAHPVARHAYPVSKSLMQATSAQGNRIVSIDGHPAFEVYQRVIQEEYGVALTRENFYAHAVHFPFGVVTAVDVLVRIPVGLGDDGSLICVGEIPPASMLRLLRAPSLDASHCVGDLQRLLPTPPQGQDSQLLTFYCAGRRMHFGDAATQELALLQKTVGCATLGGALSLGEIDSLEDFNFPRFHNAALVCLRLQTQEAPS